MSSHSSPGADTTAGAPDAVVLFSGGLDSILAARVLEAQGVRVRCLHCVSPFFGEPAAVPRWRRLYGLDIDILDVGEAFAAMLRQRPAHGFGKVLNPCVDCKILLLRHARRHMEAVGATFLASGEVIGQRPMSQRRDTLHLIPREAGVRGLLLRPLCAQHLPPTDAEERGLVDRSRLLAISGRGRTEQLALAREFGLTEIPTPGGGCRLTERENARRHWPLLTRQALGLGPDGPDARDFQLANLGRQLWRAAPANAAPVSAAPASADAGGSVWHWLCIGRNNRDNEKLAAAARPHDLLLRLCGLPGPLALTRGGLLWDRAVLAEAASLMAACAPRAVSAAEAGGGVTVAATPASGGAASLSEQDGGRETEASACAARAGRPGRPLRFAVRPVRQLPGWDLMTWEAAREEIRAEARLRAAAMERAAPA